MPTWRFDSSDSSQGTIYCSVNGYSARNGASELAFTIEAAPLMIASALPSLPPAPSTLPSVSTSWSPSATVSTSYSRSASVTPSRLPSGTLSPTRSSSASLNVRSIVANGAVLSGTVTQGRYLFFVLASANATGYRFALTPSSSVDVDLYCGLQAPSDTSGTSILPNYAASSTSGSGSVDTIDFVPYGATPAASSYYSRVTFTPGQALWCAVYGYSSSISALSFTIRVTTFAVQAQVTPSATVTASAAATPLIAQSVTFQMGPQPIFNALASDQYSYFWAPSPATGVRVTVASTSFVTSVTIECGVTPPPSTTGTIGLGSGALLSAYASDVPTQLDLMPSDALPDYANSAPSLAYYDPPATGGNAIVWCAVRGYSTGYGSAVGYSITAQPLNSSTGRGGAAGLDGIPPPCARAADIVWVLDGSGSIGTSNFELVRRLVDDFALLFPIAPQPLPGSSYGGEVQGIRMAAVEFASQSDGLAVIPLAGVGAASSSSAFIASMRNLPYFGGGTDTAYGIGGGMNQLRGYPRGPAAGAARVLIVLTDGYSNSQTATLAAAADVRSLGVAIAVITVGSSINWDEIVGMAGPAGSGGGDANYVFALEDWTRLRSVVGGNAGFLANFSRVVCEAPAIVPAGPATVWPQLTCSNATAGVPGGAPIRFEVDTSASVALSAELAGGGTLTLCYAIEEAPPSWLAVSAALAVSPTATAPIPGVTCTQAAADATSRQAVVATTVLRRPVPEPGSFLQMALFATAGLPVPGSIGGFNVSCGGPARVAASYCAVLIVGSVTSANPTGMRWFGNPAAGMCARCPPGTSAGPSATTASPAATAPFTCIDTSSLFAADVSVGTAPVLPSAAPTPSGTPRPLGASPSPQSGSGSGSGYYYASPTRTRSRSRSRGSSPAPGSNSGSGSGSGIGGSGDWWLSPSPSQDPSIAFGFLISGGSSSSGMSPGAIIGIVAGVAVVGVTVTIALLCACRGNPACPCSEAAARRRAGLLPNAKLAGYGVDGPQGQTTQVQMHMQMHPQQMQMPSPYGPYFGGPAPGSPAMAAAGGSAGSGAGTFMFSHPMMAVAGHGSPAAPNTNLTGSSRALGRALHFKLARSSMMAGHTSAATSAGAAAAAAGGGGGAPAPGQRFAAAPTASSLSGGGGLDDPLPLPYAYPQGAVPLAQPYMQPQPAQGLAPAYPGYSLAPGGFRPLAAVPISAAAAHGGSGRGLRTASNGGGLRTASGSGGLRTASGGLRGASSRGLRTPSAGASGLRTASIGAANALRTASSNLIAARGMGGAAAAAAAAYSSAEDPSRIAGAVSRSNSRSFDPSTAVASAPFADGDATAAAAAAASAARHAANIKLLGAYGASAAAAAALAARPGGGLGRGRQSSAHALMGAGGGGGADGEDGPSEVLANANSKAKAHAHAPAGRHAADDGDDDDDDGEGADVAGSGADAFSSLRLPLDASLAAYIGCDAATGALSNPAAFASYWLFLTGCAPDYAATYARLERLMHESEAAREGLAGAVEGGAFSGGAAFLHDYFFASPSPAAAAVLADVGTSSTTAAGGGSSAVSATPIAVAAAGGGSGGVTAARAPRASRKTLSRAQQAALLAAPPPPARMVLPATVKHKTAVVVKERIVLRRAGMGGAAGTGAAAGGAGAGGGISGGVGVSSRGVVAFEGVKERRVVETETARSPRSPQTQQPQRKATETVKAT